MEHIDNIELDLLLEAIFKKYGYDFRNYAHSSLKRRVQGYLIKAGVNRISELIPKVLYDPKIFQGLLNEFSIQVTDMFRDTYIFRSLRVKVLPYLKTYPYFKIWHAGCATGEEVYSLAILLKEEGIYDRATIYATDFNDVALQKASEGIYPLTNIQKYSENYIAAGCTGSFSDYYHAGYESAIISPSLKERITFANHNLVTDSSFGEMNLIICRNVLIYFDKQLQNQVLELFRDSLIHKGFMVLGTKETIAFSSCDKCFIPISEKEKIYQKK